MPYIPTGRPRGRPPGSINKATARMKELIHAYTDEMVYELQRIAGIGMVPAFKKNGEPILNADGSPKMVKAQGSKSDTARMMAIGMLQDRGYGKATQKIAGDDDEAPIQTTKVEHVLIPVGTALNDDGASSDPETDGGEQEDQAA